MVINMDENKIQHTQWLREESEEKTEWMIRYLKKSPLAMRLLAQDTKYSDRNVTYLLSDDGIKDCYKILSNRDGSDFNELRRLMQAAWNTYKSRSKNKRDTSVQISKRARRMAGRQAKKEKMTASEWVDRLILSTLAETTKELPKEAVTQASSEPDTDRSNFAKQQYTYKRITKSIPCKYRSNKRQREQTRW